jgi:hypothetical protein
MDLKRLRTFVTVAELHFPKCARKNHHFRCRNGARSIYSDLQNLT